MATLKATIAMVIWSVAVGYGLWRFGAQDIDHLDWRWALGTAAALLITLMVNAYMFAKIGKGKQWHWFK